MIYLKKPILGKTMNFDEFNESQETVLEELHSKEQEAIGEAEVIAANENWTQEEVIEFTRIIKANKLESEINNEREIEKAKERRAEERKDEERKEMRKKAREVASSSNESL